MINRKIVSEEKIMFVEYEVFIGFRDVSMGNKLSNTALLAYLEDAGGIHSNIAKLGLNDIPETRKKLDDFELES